MLSRDVVVGLPFSLPRSTPFLPLPLTVTHYLPAIIKQVLKIPRDMAGCKRCKSDAARKIIRDERRQSSEMLPDPSDGEAEQKKKASDAGSRSEKRGE